MWRGRPACEFRHRLSARIYSLNEGQWDFTQQSSKPRCSALAKKRIDDNCRVCHPDDSYRQCFNIHHVSSPQPNIGRAEMEVLQFVTEHHPVSVREVADHFASTKGQVRTTLLNVMERLRKKGYLIRRKEKGIFRYSPSVPKGELLRDLIHDFVGKTLGGSVSPFVAYLADEAKMSESDIAELRKIVRQLKKPD